MNKNEFNELAQSARETNLADFFRYSGYSLKKHGAEIYIKEYPGLCVNERTNEWFNHYENVGGKNAVDCLVKVCGRDFKRAVYELTGQDIGNSSNLMTESEAKKILGIERGYVKFWGNATAEN